MIMDRLAEFCDNTSLNTGGADNYAIGSSVDLVDARDAGNGQPLYLIITVQTAVDSTSDNTVVELQLRSDATSSVDPDSGTLHLSTGAIPQAQWTLGRTFVYPLPTEGLVYERYLGITQVTSVAAVTAGAINAFLTIDGHGWKAYADAVN